MTIRQMCKAHGITIHGKLRRCKNPDGFDGVFWACYMDDASYFYCINNEPDIRLFAYGFSTTPHESNFYCYNF